MLFRKISLGNRFIFPVHLFHEIPTMIDYLMVRRLMSVISIGDGRKVSGSKCHDRTKTR